MELPSRINALKEKEIYLLSEEGISNGTILWDYKKIDLVQLKYTPTRYESGIYQCAIHSVHGKLTLSNREYVSLGKFEFHNSSYQEFVKDLHEKLQKLPGVEYRTGYSFGRYVLELIAMLIFVPLVTYLAVAFGSKWVSLAIFLIMAARLIPYFIKNRPRVYKPDAIPEQLLPTIKS